MNLTRRNLFQLGAAAPAARLLAQEPPKYDLRKDLAPSRLTCAMWDFSWLKSHYPGGPFEDWERTTDQLLERRFNTVRIDCFPVVIGELKDLKDSAVFPAAPTANWGFSDRDRSHAVAQDLVAFMAIAKRKGLHVILSTWSQAIRENKELRTRYAANRDLYRRGWTRTLDLLGERDLLATVLYVDLDQEFPHFSPYGEAIKALASDSTSRTTSAEAAMEEACQGQQSTAGMAWNPAQMRFVRQLLNEMLPYFQSRYPSLRFTYSLTGFFKEIRALGLQLFDVLELHLWILSPRFNHRTGFQSLKKDRAEKDYKDYAVRVRKTLDAIRPMLLQEMHNKLAFATEWGREIAAPVVTTEAWGPWWHMDHPDLEWQWLKDWCEECMGLAGQYGFWGTTPWNYAHPYWRSWTDVEWYRRVNGRFLES